MQSQEHVNVSKDLQKNPKDLLLLEYIHTYHT